MPPPEQLGPYKIGRRLGRGGMGTVFEGTHVSTGERAAVKVLAPMLAADDSFRLRFSGEIDTLKRLQHPNIVQLFGYGEQGGTVYYAMELVEGTNLEEELVRGRRFGWREAVRIGVEVCRALKHAHDHGVIHRDLKPANLMWGKDEQVKLTDFGIAKFFGASSLTAEGVIGTADYMAPEQADARPVTVRSDLYSLGCVLYAVLVGEPPFKGRTLAEVLYKLKHEEPSPIAARNPDAPRAFDAIVGQLLRKDPQQRFRSATAVSKALQAMEHALSVHPEEAPAAEPDPGFVLNEPKSRPDATRMADALVHQRPTDRQGTAAPAVPASGPTRLVAAGPGTQRDAVAPAEPAPPPSVPPTASAALRADHFTRVEGSGRLRAGDEDEAGGGWAPMAIAGTILAVVAIWFAWLLWPPSADRLHERIAAAAGDADRLLAAEADMTQFVARFPDDPRRAEVQGWLAEVELARKEKKLAAGGQRSGKLDPVARAYREAVELMKTDPDRAAAKLQALIDAFGTPGEPADGDAAAILELARRQLADLKAQLAALAASDRAAFEGRLARAEQLAPRDPAASATILRGALALWGDQPWAGELAAKARQQLAEVEKIPLESSDDDRQKNR